MASIKKASPRWILTVDRIDGNLDSFRVFLYFSYSIMSKDMLEPNSQNLFAQDAVAYGFFKRRVDAWAYAKKIIEIDSHVMK